MKKKLTTVAVCALVVCGLLLSSGAFAGKPTNAVQNGNDLPSGKHYNLNIIGAKNVGNVDNGNSMGNTLFVKLDGKTKIIMTQAEDGVFQVTDRNGLDNDGAAFNIAPEVYDVYARALGKPGGKVNISANYTKAGDDLYLGTVRLDREKGKPMTVNINKLFYLGNDWIFYIDEFEGYYWEYNNDKLKLCQVRFYVNTTYSGTPKPTPTP